MVAEASDARSGRMLRGWALWDLADFSTKGAAAAVPLSFRAGGSQ